MRRLGARELQAYLGRVASPPLLLDVREPWEYAICHLAQARLVPMRQIPQALGQLVPDRETVVICHHGIRSARVARYLEQQGFSAVINLDGGMDAWAREVDRSMATY